MTPAFKGQLGVPLTVYPWYLLCSLGIYTHKYPQIHPTIPWCLCSYVIYTTQKGPSWVHVTDVIVAKVFHFHLLLVFATCASTLKWYDIQWRPCWRVSLILYKAMVPVVLICLSDSGLVCLYFLTVLPASPRSHHNPYQCLFPSPAASGCYTPNSSCCWDWSCCLATTASRFPTPVPQSSGTVDGWNLAPPGMYETL